MPPELRATIPSHSEQMTYQGIEWGSKEKHASIDPFRRMRHNRNRGLASQ